MNTEPLVTVATIIAGITALIGLAVAFGLNLSNDEQAAIMAITAVVAPLVVAALARGKVTPVGRGPNV